MPLAKFELAVEELAYAMGVLGGTDTAVGFLLALLGERPHLETEGRLLAASHALVARGYLDFDAKTGDKWLTEGLRRVVMPMLQNDFSIRCSWAAKGHEDILTLYAASGKLAVHQLHREVVSLLQQLSDWKAAQNHLLTFFDLPTIDGGESPDKLATLPADLVDTLRRGTKSRSLERTTSQLRAHGVPEDAATELAADLRQHGHRGSIIRITRQGDQVVSNQGFLILKAEKRSWFLVIHPDDEPLMDIYAGSPALFKQLFTSLVS